jgi:ABC-type glycerol-3-phosphate transport system substrate-binding protein
MRRVIYFLLVLSLIGGSVFARGRNDTSASGVTTVKIMSVWQTENPESGLEMAIAKKFEEQNSDIKLEFIGIPMNDLWAKMTAQATASDLPDVFFLNSGYTARAVELEIVEDIKNLWTPQELAEYSKIAIDDCMVGDVLTYLPFYATPQAMIYRYDWLQEKGLKPPVTWEDFRNVGKAFTEDLNGDGRPDRYGFAMLAMRNGSAASRFLQVVRTFGVNELYQKPDGSWTTDVGSPKFKEALKVFTDFANVDRIVPPGVIETGYPEASQQIASGLAGMMITGSNAIGTIYAQAPELRGKLGSCLIPRDMNHYSQLGLNGYAIYAKSRNKQAAARWIKFMYQDDNMLGFITVSGRTPTKPALANAAEFKTPAFEGYLEAEQWAQPLPLHPGYNELSDVMGEAYQNTIANGMSIDEAAARAQQRVLAIIKKYE